MQEGRTSPGKASIGKEWAFWPGWRGPLELILRAGRAATEAARELGMSAPNCRVELRVTVSHDVERFDSLEAFRDDVTQSGLKKFESIQLIVSEAGCDSIVSVCFVAGGLLVHHGPPECEWLRRGVLVQVCAPVDMGQTLRNVRDDLERAAGRGWHSVDGVYRGGDSGQDVQLAISTVLAERRQLSIESRLLACILTLAAVVALSALLSVLGGWPVQRNPQSHVYEAGLWWVLVLVASLPAGAIVTARLIRWGADLSRSVSVGATGSLTWRLAVRLFSTTTGRFVGAIGALIVAALLGVVGAK